VNITEVTTDAGWIAGLAIVALIAAGWRKPARATADPLRARRPLRTNPGLPMTELETEEHQRTPLWLRVWAVIAGSAMGVLLGAIFATVVGFSVAWVVIRLSDLLRR
jgi:hypothetical protein